MANTNHLTPLGGYSDAGAQMLRKMSENAPLLTDFLRFQGRVFKHPASIALEFFTQKPDATFIATAAQWEKMHRAYLFESAIDLMSFYSFCKQKELLEGSALISMAGLKPSIPKKLRAEGVEIISCVDSDEAGQRFEHDNGFARSESVRQKLDDFGFKDWNERLVFTANHPDIDLRTVHREQVEQITARRTH